MTRMAQQQHQANPLILVCQAESPRSHLYIISFSDSYQPPTKDTFHLAPMNPHCCAQTCAFYSATGIVFTGWVGIMLVKQPFFIGGIDNVDDAKTSAFGAAGMFLFCFVVSIIFLVRSSGQQIDPSPSRGRAGGGVIEYGQVPASTGAFT